MQVERVLRERLESMSHEDPEHASTESAFKQVDAWVSIGLAHIQYDSTENA